ncbi:single-pass membrane and coiled-coil domain-containing protein 4 homolog [Haematobia irritans]|uniref:single-pass membrane and coiled-coil domain-containing protein 4 homolog n=1 Tax=Haematobia irritans TaxID=7368 RepID=UPI003F50AF4F
MRQLKGKVKETRKQRKERRLENLAIQNQMKTVVLPVIGVLALVIAVFVYIKTRPSAIITDV